jgi:hypothetical protein
MTRGLVGSFRKKFTSMLHDPSNAYSVTAFAASEIKQIDQLIEHLEDRTSANFLQPLFEELDQILGSLYAIYLNELQFLADGEPQNVAANQIARDFTAIRPIVAALRNELSLGEQENALETARDLKTAVGKLFGSFADMKYQALEGPRYSELPFTQELLRVVHHYLKGSLALSSVQERLDAFCNYHDNLEISLEQMVPTAAEAPIMEARREDLEDALALQLQGIEDLDVALERRSDKGVKRAAEALSVAAETLYEIYEELQRAEMEPATVSCFRCGTSNTAAARLCSSCGAVLPRFDAGSAGDRRTTTLEIKESPDGAQQEKPEELLRLEAAVTNAVRANDSTIITRALEAFEARLKVVNQRMAAFKEAPSDIPSDHLRVLTEGRARFQESMEILVEGHSLLSEGAHNLDPALLRRGLEEVEAGYQVMQGFTEVFERAEKLSPSPAQPG